MNATLLIDAKNALGESCFWDSRDNCLWWTDIESSCVYRMTAQQAVTRFTLPGRAGFILPRKKTGFVIGFPHQIVLTDQALQTFTRLHDVEPELHQTRINDATVDPFGGIVFGTFDETANTSDRQPIASVYRLAPDQSLSKLFNNVVISNGLAFSPSGDIMYFADTPEGRIRRFSVGKDFSSLSEIDPLALADAAPGSPDGGTVDSQGNYWSARVWGGCAVRIAPDGSINARIDLPTKGPTCVALGGDSLCDLYITTLRVRHSNEELAAAPDAGGVYVARTDIPGLKQPFCAL